MRSTASFGSARKAKLLRPDAFTVRHVERLRSMKRPGFETLQQQNPCARDRLHIRAEHSGVFIPAMVPPDGPVVLSIDPEKKGGPMHSNSVVQAWAPTPGRYLLLNSWRGQARYADFRDQVRRFKRRFRPSAILVETTGQGPALISDIEGSKDYGSNRSHRTRIRSPDCTGINAIRSGIVALPEAAPWVTEFIDEAVQFPYGHFDDQIDAMTQFLDWIAEHPHLGKRPPRALGVAISSSGVRLLPSCGPPTAQCRGAVFSAVLDAGNSGELFCPKTGVAVRSTGRDANRRCAIFWWTLPCRQSIRLTGTWKM